MNYGDVNYSKVWRETNYDEKMEWDESDDQREAKKHGSRWGMVTYSTVRYSGLHWNTIVYSVIECGSLLILHYFELNIGLMIVVAPEQVLQYTRSREYWRICFLWKWTAFLHCYNDHLSLFCSATIRFTEYRVWATESWRNQSPLCRWTLRCCHKTCTRDEKNNADVS